MALTFLVEDGTGLPTATSVVTVEEADDINTVNVHSNAAWEALDQSVKERLLVWATRYLDAVVQWRGCKAVETSALRWPRRGVIDRDRRLIGDHEIPMQLKIAVASMATYLMAQDRSVEGETDGLVRIKADVVELEFLEGYKLPQVPSHMRYLLEGLGSVNTGYPRFAPAVK